MTRSNSRIGVPAGIVAVLAAVVVSGVFVVGRSVAQESTSTSTPAAATSATPMVDGAASTTTAAQAPASIASKSSAVTRGDLTETLSTRGTLRAATTWVISHQSDQVVTSSAAANAGAANAGGGNAVVAAGITAAAEGDPPTDSSATPGPTSTTAPTDTSAPTETTTPLSPTTTVSTTPATQAPATQTGGAGVTGGAGAAPGGAAARSVSSPKSFVLTSIAKSGERIDFGSTLYSADDVPTILLPGSIGAYRTLNSGVSDGADVQQLETALSAAGFDPGTIDTHFDASTKTAVTAWQESRGLSSTGVVALGDVVFSPTPVVVESASLAAGSSISDGTEVLTVRSTDIVAEIAVTDALSPHLHVGDKMQARLPDRSAVPVTIAVIVNDPANGRIAIATFDKAPAITVTPVPLTVSLTVAMASNTLIVDALAIVHLEGGVDAVRLDSGELVPVTIVATTGSKAAVTGDKLTTASKLITS
ncbi:MAG: peptidoglycan-binding protein [Acidimicrobiia bacterium]